MTHPIDRYMETTVLNNHALSSEASVNFLHYAITEQKCLSHFELLDDDVHPLFRETAAGHPINGREAGHPLGGRRDTHRLSTVTGWVSSRSCYFNIEPVSSPRPEPEAPPDGDRSKKICTYPPDWVLDVCGCPACMWPPPLGWLRWKAYGR